MLCSYTVEKQDQQSTIKKRKPTKDTDSDSVEDVPPVGQTKQVTFEVQPLRSVTTDFCGDGAFQKCVRFSPDGSILATGGGDGHLRVWKVYRLFVGAESDTCCRSILSTLFYETLPALTVRLFNLMF